MGDLDLIFESGSFPEEDTAYSRIPFLENSMDNQPLGSKELDKNKLTLYDILSHFPGRMRRYNIFRILNYILKI